MKPSFLRDCSEAFHSMQATQFACCFGIVQIGMSSPGRVQEQAMQFLADKGSLQVCGGTQVKQGHKQLDNFISSGVFLHVNMRITQIVACEAPGINLR